MAAQWGLSTLKPVLLHTSRHGRALLMVIDPSAVLAILQNEPERAAFNAAIAAAEQRRLSAASLVELSIVMEARFGIEGHHLAGLNLGDCCSRGMTLASRMSKR